MDEIITDKQLQETYSKLKQVDKFAKSLGFTIYKIVLDFEINGKIHTLSDTSLNRRDCTPENGLRPIP